MNAQELFIDVSTGRFLDGETTIPISTPKIFANSQKFLKINVLNIKKNVVSKILPSQNSKFKARLGSTTAKLAEQEDAITTSALIQAQGVVVTSPASAATGLGTADIFSPVTAAIKASITSLPAVTATVAAKIVYVPPVTASITCGLISQTTFSSTTIFQVPLREDLAPKNRVIAANTKNLPSDPPGSLVRTRILDFTSVSLSVVAQATFQVTTSGASIDSINISNRGSGYPDGLYYVDFSGGTPSVTASALATCSGGIVTTVSLISGGTYASTPCAFLFAPAKGIASIFPTNIERSDSKNVYFRWVRGLTSVSQQNIPLTFSSPDVSSSVTPTRKPSAHLEYVPESQVLRTNSQNLLGNVGPELGNLWKIVISDPGYGYSSAPSVSHGSAQVSSYVYGAQPVLFREGEQRSQSTPFERFETWVLCENFSEKPVNIGFKGCAIVPNIALAANTMVAYGRIDSPRPPITRRNVTDFFPGPFVNPDGTLRYRNLCPIFPSPVPLTATAVEPMNPIDNDPTYGVRYPQRNIPARFSAWQPSIVQSGGLAALIEAGGFYASGEYNCSFATQNENTDHNFLTIKIPPIDDRFKIVLKTTDSSGRTVFIPYSGGGLWFSSWQVSDYGENYDYVIAGKSRASAKDATLKALTEIFPGTVLNETFFNISSATIPNTIANGFLPSNIGFKTTVATRPGARFTQTFVEIGSNMIFAQPNAIASQIVVSASGTVGTASVANSPMPYADGSYELSVQSPTTGSTAKLNLVINRGSSRVVILDGGFGYTSAPIITAPAPNAKNGYVSSAEITNIPFGYLEGKSYPLEVSNSPTTGGSAALSLIRIGNKYSVNIDSPGVGYVSPPTVTAPGPELQNIGNLTNLVLQSNPVGYLPNTSLALEIQESPNPQGQASGLLEINSSGVARAVILNPGFGYTSAPIVTAPGPNKFSGQIVGATITTHGKGFPIGVYPCIVTTAPNGGETAKISLVVENLPRREGLQAPSIKFKIDSPGYGYTTNPIITAPTPPGNSVVAISITCQGAFYTNETASYEFTDATGAGATLGKPVVSAGKISLIPVIYGGGNYSDNPKISFGDPDLPEDESIPGNQIFAKFEITSASANTILTGLSNKDIILEVYETDGIKEQVLVHGTMNLSKRVLP